MTHFVRRSRAPIAAQMRGSRKQDCPGLFTAVPEHRDATARASWVEWPSLSVPVNIVQATLNY